MNELLGWYGYERLELRRWAASRARDASSPEQANEQKNKGKLKGRVTADDWATLLKLL